MLINLFQVVDMQTQYLNSMLATASQWGLSIDSETQPYGNAGEALRNALCFLPESISFLYPLSMDVVHVCVRIGHHRTGRLDPEYPQPRELERERCGIPGEIRHERQLLEEWPLWVSVLFLNRFEKLVYLTHVS